MTTAKKKKKKQIRNVCFGVEGVLSENGVKWTFVLPLQEVIFQIVFWELVLCLVWWGAHVVSTEMKDNVEVLGSSIILCSKYSYKHT